MLTTPWGEALDADAVLQEYPRPQMVRKSYINLNGYWDYAITEGRMEPRGWDGRILVPFSPEAPLSGVGRTLQPWQTLWYRRSIELEPRAGQRLLLHFGAVDQSAEIYVNGALAGQHVGGYTAFSVDITPFITSGRNELRVAVTDGTDTNELSRGKQKTKRGGIWYTPQSGIWQTVWMEWVPEAHIAALRITPDVENSCARIAVCSDTDGECSIEFNGAVYKGFTNREICVPVESPELWTPETPKLYDFSAVFGEDRVESYFALRCVGTGKDGRGKPCLLLNGKPIYHSGVLDQGYWPDGLYTAPSDEAFIYDIELMKSMGFNTLRKHIKIEPMRWYYHCDRMGMLVWQDMPSGGGDYSPIAITLPLVTRRAHSDHDYKYFARTDAYAREVFRRELDEMVTQLYNCPSIVMWVPFNEGWGQFDASDAAAQIKALDTTRTIDHASGWHDQGIGDVQSLHVYFYPYRYSADKLGRAVVLSEFGGYQLPCEGHTFNSANFGYRAYKTPEALEKAFCALFRREIMPAREKGLAASIYTQLSDVEDEVNGIVSYDRRVVKLSAAAVREINEALIKA